MTGRGAGYCAGNDVPGDGGFGPRRGFGRGRGRRGGGGGFRAAGMRGGARFDYGPAAPEMTSEQEADWLKKQAQNLKDTLKRVQDRLDELKE